MTRLSQSVKRKLPRRHLAEALGDAAKAAYRAGAARTP